MGKAKSIGRAVACGALLWAASAAVAQAGLGPVSASEFVGGDRSGTGAGGGGGIAAPRAEQTRDDDEDTRRIRIRSGRSAVRLGGGLVAVVGGLAGRSAMTGKPKHTDGKARGRGVTQNSSVPPGSTRFR